MSNPIGGIQQPPVPGSISTGAGAAEGKIGQRAGQKVVTSNGTSPLDVLKAAEEIGMAKNQFKKLEKRELSKGSSRKARMLELIRKIQSIEKIQGVNEFKDRLASNPNLTRKEFQQQAENNFADVFHQYVALYEAADAYETRHGEGSADEIYGAIKELETNHQQAIRIGLNLSEEAASILDENNLETLLTEVRQEYFDHVQDHKTLEKLYVELVKRHGAGSFESAVDMQLRLLSTDLACLESSAPPERLRAVINDMARLKILVGVHENCMETEEQIGRQPHHLKIAADELMVKLLGLVNQQWITETDFTGLARELGVTELQPKIFFMNKTAETVNMMPAEIFTNTEAQMAMLGTIREVQDALVIEEESGNTSVDKNYGTVGEVTLDARVLEDIAAPLGINLPGVTDNIMPEVMQPGKLSPGSEAQDQKPEKTVAAQEKSTGLDGSSSKVPEATQKPANSEPAEITASGSLDGLSNKELRARQDVDLARAAELQQQKGEKFVVDSSLGALKDSLAYGNGADNILSALNNITKARGRQFAKGLKIAITPKDGDKPLNLIPPGEELRGVANLEELVKTAITVLEEHEKANFSNFNPADIEKELAKLKESISLMDSKMTSKPRGRSKGEKQYNQLEYSRNFSIRAAQLAATVEAALDPPKDPSVAAANQLQDLLQFDEIPAKGTADYIAAKALEKIDGERYGNTEGLMKDITSLAGQPAQLDKLLGYMNAVIESKTSIPFLGGREEAIKNHIQSLSENKLPNALDAVTRTDISVRN